MQTPDTVEVHFGFGRRLGSLGRGVWGGLLAAVLPAAGLSAAGEAVDFGRDILPLLSDRCFECHGPDAANREAGLRLDRHEGVLGALKSGAVPVVPGDSGASEVYRRIQSDDPNDVMPPPESGKRLSPGEIEAIRAWIDGGAEWGGHWAYEAPGRPAVPGGHGGEGWTAYNAVDLFIQASLRRAGLDPEPPADRETLIRRVTLDLTGLPPGVDEVDEFLRDTSPNAYERVVDRLLGSKAYGEHRARYWLDAARYADTHGLHLDNERSIWPYRDWVIEAFNRNQPFDRFTVEQLAGDLLPGATLPQKVATGFNRCNVTTSEGGSIDEEYYVRYAVDRVETTATVWLGLTAGCAACHDHKFDPLTQREFYSLFAYFFSLTERAMDGNALLPPPSVRVPAPWQEERGVELRERLTAVRGEIRGLLAGIEYEDPSAGEVLAEAPSVDRVWFDDELPAGAAPSGNKGDASWQWGGESDGYPVFSGERSTRRSAKGLSQHFFTGATEPLVIDTGVRLFAYVYLDPDNPPETVQLQFNDGNWSHRAYWGADKGHGAGASDGSNRPMGPLPEPGNWVRLEVAAADVDLKPGARVGGWALTQFGGTVYWDRAGIVTVQPLPPEQLASFSLWEQHRRRSGNPPVPDDVRTILDKPAGDRSEAEAGQVREYYLQHVHPETSRRFEVPLARERELSEAIAELERSIPSTLVMEDRAEPRQAHVLERGEYTLKRDPVEPGVPGWLVAAPEGAPPNRLGLAQWLTRPDHPLTARVAVNRFWEQIFGTGIVRTSEDFGLQGEAPSHPELLDWLAVDFVESGWDVKRLLKMLVMSATYRQSSRVSPEKRAVDPDNRLLARGPRHRLDAEVVRDQALAISGLLVGTTGGSSVRPYQPEGLWKPVGFGGSNTSVFVQDHGFRLYRRSMYTFWKRTSPPPSMATFDAPNRETCRVRRARTNTPLQALVLMNDVQYVEAARKFAERVLLEGGDDMDRRIVFAVRSVLARHPTAAEAESLRGLLTEFLGDFRGDETAAGELLSVGESPRNETLDPVELAAWTVVAQVLFNLSETITKG